MTTAVELGGCGGLYSPSIREGSIPETGFPPNDILGNSEGGKGLWHQKSVLNQKRYTLLVDCNKMHKIKGCV